MTKRRSRRKNLILAAFLTAQVIFHIASFSLMQGAESAWCWIKSAVPSAWGDFLTALQGGIKY